jgi:hypothetical protein
MKVKQTSYQKLKLGYDRLWDLYVKNRKRLTDLGEGVDEDDFLIGGEELTSGFKLAEKSGAIKFI